jgi:tRNA nucleotidyltransferase (CCA-adding enzyme)
MVFDASRSLTEDPKIWYAASLHDLGKTKTDKNIWPKQHNHEDLGEPLVVDLSKKLNVPPDVAELARLVAKNHLRCHTAMSLTDKALQRLFSEFKGDRKLLEDFVMACKADAQGRLGKASEPYPQAEYLLRKFDEFNNKPPPFSLAISGKDLTFVPPGKEMGAILKNLKERVLNGSLENDYDTLMQEARKFNV